jgi:CHASE2 domain-containing sensor protein
MRVLHGLISMVGALGVLYVLALPNAWFTQPWFGVALALAAVAGFAVGYFLWPVRPGEYANETSVGLTCGLVGFVVVFVMWLLTSGGWPFPWAPASTGLVGAGAWVYGARILAPRLRRTRRQTVNP